MATRRNRTFLILVLFSSAACLDSALSSFSASGEIPEIKHQALSLSHCLSGVEQLSVLVIYRQNNDYAIQPHKKVPSSIPSSASPRCVNHLRWCFFFFSVRT
ncbi:hypothetical protein P170DRAFT_286549 [Aspergillus steynii IBT 23096]|uniref:Uncharacterized protein n=1 Tax=Aspergillus steynii IBT 23096 TaxID=1392250 RepID=A0A2I2FUY6_9EURO|nr:uncharacterized protein P170DRAFT_286549 [Aspergillus steynii IBT 23096]PLB44453.1 hypothetical protein P170DRAFT_286549 [Aspergillus steynii IBT 23096]